MRIILYFMGYETQQVSYKIGRDPGVLLSGYSTLQIVLNLINFKVPEHFSCGALLRISFAVARTRVVPRNRVTNNIIYITHGQMPNRMDAFTGCKVNTRNPAWLKAHARVLGVL